jgi:hypothetical protein
MGQELDEVDKSARIKRKITFSTVPEHCAQRRTAIKLPWD